MQERIIQFLKESDGYISGEEISQRLKTSRAAVWKHMQELRALGYEIVAVPHLGYQLVTCPDKLLGFEIQSGLNTKILANKIIILETVPCACDFVMPVEAPVCFKLRHAMLSLTRLTRCPYLPGCAWPSR